MTTLIGAMFIGGESPGTTGLQYARFCLESPFRAPSSTSFFVRGHATYDLIDAEPSDTPLRKPPVKARIITLRALQDRPARCDGGPVCGRVRCRGRGGRFDGRAEHIDVVAFVVAGGYRSGFAELDRDGGLDLPPGQVGPVLLRRIGLVGQEAVWPG